MAHDTAFRLLLCPSSSTGFGIAQAAKECAWHRSHMRLAPAEVPGPRLVYVEICADV